MGILPAVMVPQTSLEMTRSVGTHTLTAVKKRWPCLKDACAAVAKVAMNELAVFPTELMDKFTQLEQFSRLCHGLGWKYEVVETEPAILVRACVRKPPR